MERCKDCGLEIPEGKEHENCNQDRGIDTKTRVEIWDNTEENKCVHSFELEQDEIQKIAIRRNNNPRDSMFIDIETDRIVVITSFGTKEFPI